MTGMKPGNDMHSELIHKLASLVGKDILKYDDIFLLQAVTGRLAATGKAGIEEYLSMLQTETTEKELFKATLNVSYTEFFRNSVTYAYLETVILPHLVINKINNNRNLLRIWSAGCSTGQEAYSVAFILEDLKSSMLKPFSFIIFATDISPDNIARASEGSYPAQDLDNVPMKNVSKYFEKKGNKYIVQKRIMETIRFAVFDLLDASAASPPDAVFGDFDLIICGNLLLYYNEDIRNRMIAKLSKSLNSKGFLACGESEREIILTHGFHEVFPHSSIFNQ